MRLPSTHSSSVSVDRQDPPTTPSHPMTDVMGTAPTHGTVAE